MTNLAQLYQLAKEEADRETIRLSFHIIKHCQNKKIPITNLKLNKLLYFANIDYLK